MTVLHYAKEMVTTDSGGFWIALLSAAVFGLYIFYTKSSAEKRQISLLPTITKTHWEVLKQTLTVANLSQREILPYYANVYKENGPFVHFRILTRDYILINDPDDIKVLLSSTQHITKGPEYELFKPWLNKGLLTSTGQKWHARRKLLTNTFHFKILETYIPALNKHSRSLVENLIAASDDGKRSVTDIDTHITLCALDIVCETIMGVNLRSQEGNASEYVKAIKEVSHILIQRVFQCWYWSETIFNMCLIGFKFRKSLKVVHDFTKNVIKEKREIMKSSKREKLEENGKRRVLSFLDLLIEISDDNPDIMTDNDIREEVDTFLFEGHDTSSIALTMALVHLGLNQKIQTLVRDELYEIFGDSDRDATIEDLKAMPNLERVIKETMRMYPSVTGITRTLTEPLHFNKYTIPPKALVVVIFHLLHRDENLFPNPEEFDPDRFLPEVCAKRHPYAYLPFSAGPRNCIGQKFAMYQMKTVLSTILRKTKIETLGTQKDIIISTKLIMRADCLPSISIKPIHNNNDT